MPTNQLSHNDNPVHINSLTDDDFIKDIAEVIRKCEPPKGLGINGYWGTGKTSALMQLHYELVGVAPFDKKQVPRNSPVIPVWFEAWRYQHDALPIIALLNEIRASFGLWTKFVEKSGDMFGITLLGVLGAFDETIKVASGEVMSPKLGAVPKIGEQWEKEHYKTPLPSQNISSLLENAIEKALGGKDKKLVIFIDDLDRCTPATALKLLEGIKVYLNLKNCVVIFGMDQRQIERALVKALDLKDDDNKHSDHYAREYLEKICQDIYYLPLPDNEAKHKYLDKLLQYLDLGGNEESQRGKLQFVAKNYDCLPANPRKIKALSNRLAVMLRYEKVKEHMNAAGSNNAEIERKYALLMAIAIIYTFHRLLYEQLEKNPAYIDQIGVFSESPSAVLGDPIYEPMKSLKPSLDGGTLLPSNPSDSNVFRLHELFNQLNADNDITDDEIKPFLGI